MATQTQSNKQQENHSIVWFEIPSDNPERAKSFYNALFGWKIEKFPGAAMEYWHIDTGGADASPDGGLMKRQSPQQQGITSYVSVPSVDQFAAKVQKLGGRFACPKQPCRKWATSLSARIPRTTCLPCGRRTKTQSSSTSPRNTRFFAMASADEIVG